MSNIAIACQGGGSHTAFTAGVLKGLIPSLAESEHELVGLSGTSGGALSALVTWYGLLDEGPESVGRRLDALWADIAAADPVDRFTNEWLVGWSRAEIMGAPVPTVSPYHLPTSGWGQRRLRRLIEQQVDFSALDDLAGERAPKLVVASVNINHGTFETFVGSEITPDVVMASMAVPDLFQAVEMNGHYHWDGLFSQNPPVRELMAVPVRRKPDELWVIQINPQTTTGEPSTLLEIADRRNELAGNLSLNQELRFIKAVNRWIEAGFLPRDRFTQTTIRRIPLGLDLPCSSKFDRSTAFLQKLLTAGEERAANFLAGLE